MTTPLTGRKNIAIIGGGMVGLSLALLLARNCPDINITIVEAFDLLGQHDDAALPSFDARSTALSESSKSIFEGISLWQLLSDKICPIDSIHVSDRGHPGVTRMTSAESGLDSLGAVIENRQLGHVLVSVLKASTNIRVIAPDRAERLKPVVGGMAIELASGEKMVVDLAIVADGANSQTLQQLGIHTTIRDYGQTAVIANLALSRPHNGVAYERFTDEGPMALLPLLPSGEENRAALVWTMPPQQADRIIAANETDFLQQVQERFGFRAGRFCRCGSRHSYPLQLMVADEQVRGHLAVVGNAAHFLHPVAGQGFNLALRDVAQLVHVLSDAHHKKENVGSLTVLQRYADAQRKDQVATIGFSHNLPKIFGLQLTPGIVLRNAGLIALDLLPSARQEFARFGAGLANPGTGGRN